MQSNPLTTIGAWSGIAFAVTLTVVETVHNWGTWNDPPMWIVDYLACGILFLGAGLALRRHPAGGGVLAAGWGFSCGMFWMAFFFIRAEFRASANLSAEDNMVLAFAGGLFLWTIVGLCVSVAGLFRGSAAGAQKGIPEHTNE